MANRIEISPRVYHMLMDGCDFEFLDDTLGPNLGDSFLRSEWRRVGRHILAAYARENGPYCRPWAWWHFAAPEPRRVVEGEESTESGFPPWNYFPSGTPIETILKKWPAIHAGLWQEHLAGRSEREYFFGIPNPRSDAARHESDIDYLTRLDLLNDHERELLAQGEVATT